jgi:hypothetical protein
VTRFASSDPGYGSGWKAFHNGERYSDRELGVIVNSGEWGCGGWVRGYRAAAGGLGLYDEVYVQV